MKSIVVGLFENKSRAQAVERELRRRGLLGEIFIW